MMEIIDEKDKAEALQKEFDADNLEFMKAVLEWKESSGIILTDAEKAWAKENIKEKK